MTLLVHDEEYEPLRRRRSSRRHGRLRAGPTSPPATDTLEALIASGGPGRRRQPARARSVVLLTSGTTGTPKGALRQQGTSLHADRGRCCRRFRIARASRPNRAPMFHALGFTQMRAGGDARLARRSVERRFKPDARARRRAHRASARVLVVVPVMLQRIVSLLEARPERAGTRARCGSSSSSGSQLEAELVRREPRTRIGDVALQLLRLDRGRVRDVRDAGGPARRPGPRSARRIGTIVRLYDEEGRPRATGRRPGGSSSATATSSTATPVAAARRSSTG